MRTLPWTSRPSGQRSPEPYPALAVVRLDDMSPSLTKIMLAVSLAAQAVAAAAFLLPQR